jgi:small GTP-binding protein
MSGFFKDRGDSFKTAFTQKEESYFSNSTDINRFSETMIRDLASLKIIKELLKEHNISDIKVKELEYIAFNLLISQIEFKKGNSRVEVGVIGSFSSGKSTFINSLFGKSICPMAVKPTTSSITKFYYGYKEKITVDGREITHEDYHKYSQHIKGDSKNSKTHYIEYAYPFERLNSIVLYDTPGFNNNLNQNDTKVTMKTLESVDVIFFIIDISKGAIDMSSIETLHELKDKRMYCILNKSDLKSTEAISKIKSEIASKKLFLEVIEYSAYKVLEFGERNYLREHFKSIEEEFIYKKVDFSTITKGVLSRSRGRLGSRVEYKLYLDDKEFVIDDFYVASKKQRARVEKMLNRLSDSKQFTLEQKLKRDIYNYQNRSYSVMIDILENSNYILQENIIEELNNFIKEKKKYVTSL